MTWWMMVLVGAILISTLHKLLPRGRDLHLGKLRERARELGFRVELQRTPLAAGLAQGVVGYKLAVERIAAERGFAFERGAEGWRQISGPQVPGALKAQLEQLPEEVLMLERDTHFVTVYWREPNRIAVLEQLYQALKPLSDMPVGTSDPL